MKVAVIGGGAAGTLQALHLKRAGADVTLIERGPRPGRGVAYGTARPEHLLNVPARRMSAYSDDPGHFSRWYADLAGGTEESYAPRMVYGDYLAGLLNEAGIEAVRGEAVDIVDDASGWPTDDRSRRMRSCWRRAISARPRHAASIPPRLAKSGSTIPGPGGWTGWGKATWCCCSAPG